MLSVLLLSALALAEDGPAPELGVPKEPAILSFAGRDLGEEVDLVTVTLTTADGTQTVVTLHDDGVVPDRVADDGLFMGTAWFSGEAATALVQTGAQTWPAIDVPFQKGITAPVAHFTLTNGILAVEIDSPGMGGSGEAAGAGSGKGHKQAKGDKAGDKTSGKARGRGRLERIRRNQAKTTRGGNDTPIYVLAGVSVLATLAMGVLLFRGRSAGGGDPMGGLVPEPEPGLLGGALPSLSDGLCVWVCDPAVRPRLRDDAARTLAAHRRVLAAVPEGSPLPAVGGHPAYRAASVELDDIEQALDALLAAMAVPVALLLEGVGADSIGELLADLPPGTGGVVLADGAVADLPVLRFSATDEGWRVEHAGRTLRALAGPDGLALDGDAGAAS